MGRFGHRIECGKRFVHQHHGRTQRQRARDLNALLHAAGQLPRIILRVLFKTHKGQRVVNPLFEFPSIEGPFYSKRNVRRGRCATATARWNNPGIR